MQTPSAPSQTSQDAIDIEALVDRQPVKMFHVGALLWSFLTMCAEGYDIAVIGLVAPDIVRTWSMDPAVLGPVFSASLVGMMIGAPLFAAAGDRLGRKGAVVSGILLLGLSTLVSAWASNPVELAALRFLTGLGLGGVIPNLIALNAELMPKRVRTAALVLLNIGVPVGGMLPAVLTAVLPDAMGWQTLLVVGGAFPLGVALCLVFKLPESVKYLALHPGRRARLVAMLRRIEPNVHLPDAARPIVQEAVPGQGLSPAALFGERLGPMTALLWLLFFTNLMVNFFIVNWLPFLLQSGGLSMQQTGLAVAMYPIGGITGSLLLTLLMPRAGLTVIAFFFVLAAPTVAMLGGDNLSNGALLGLVLLAGCCVVGTQSGINAVAGILYPTRMRAKGTGWAVAVGRIGSILGPLIGSLLVGRQLPLQQLFYAPLVPLAVGAGACLLMAYLYFRRFGTLQLDR